jgi:hypothetical protein
MSGPVKGLSMKIVARDRNYLLRSFHSCDALRSFGKVCCCVFSVRENEHLVVMSNDID